MLDSKTLCYPGQQQQQKFAIQDSKTIKILLSWIAKLFAIQESKKNKNSAILDSKILCYPEQQKKIRILLSRIAKQLNFCYPGQQNNIQFFAIQDSIMIFNYRYPGQQNLCYPGQQNNVQILLSWIAKLLLSRIAEQFAIFAILDRKTFAIQDSSLGTFIHD